MSHYVKSLGHTAIFYFYFSFVFTFLLGISGKPIGEGMVPTNEKNARVMNPKTLDCFVVGIGLFSFALFVSNSSELVIIHLPKWLLNSGHWIIAIIFFIRAIGDFKYIGFFKRIKHSKFAKLDTQYFSPLCLLIALLAIIIEIYK